MVNLKSSLDQHGGQLHGRYVTMSHLYLVLQDVDLHTPNSRDIDKNGIDVRHAGSTVDIADEKGTEVVWLERRMRLQRLSIGDHLQVSSGVDAW